VFDLQQIQGQDIIMILICNYCKKKIANGLGVAFGKDGPHHISCLHKKLRGDIKYVQKKRNYTS